MPRKPVADSYYTLNQAAEVLGIDRHTIWRWIAAGKLASEKVGGTVLIEKSLIDRRGSAHVRP
jgi:excisionase family DNA binding protein